MAGKINVMQAIRADARTFKPSRIAAALVSGLALYGGAADRASALPSFARQTGQTCSTCHTAFPQLTPYGRRFKLGGYTAGGGDDRNLPPVSFMIQGSFTNLGKGLNAPMGAYAPPDPTASALGGFNNANNWTDLAQQTSIFYGGKIWGNLGAFVQATYAQDYGRQFSWDNTDIRYADTVKVNGVDVLWGLTFNNSPTVQDVWNTTPAWSSPFIGSPFAPTPGFLTGGATTMLEGAFWGPGQVLGAGGYVFINDMIYAELTGYGSTSNAFQWALTGGPASVMINGVAPYYRVAIEPVWGEHSLMVGAYGMSASVTPGAIGGAVSGFGNDQIIDNGFDAQYQWISDIHAVTLRANYIYEHQMLNSSYAQSLAANTDNYLRSLKLSGEYVYMNTFAFTGTYFNINGSPDALIMPSNFANSPNSEGWIFDASYLPFSRGAPGPWPWANARLGVSYTLYTRFDGGVNDIDPVNCSGCRAAKDNNTLLLYAWLMW
jgi:hypothetical protein